MTVKNLGEQNSVANQYLRELRDPEIQKDRLRFRNNLGRLGEIMAYEISKHLDYHKEEVTTPLGQAVMNLPDQEIVLLTILRAGLPFLAGFQHVFDRADTGFIGSYRVEGTSEIHVQRDYMAAPSLAGKTVIVTDTMLATGRSLVDAVTTVIKHGQPTYLHLASVISAPEGVQYLIKNIKIPATLWVFSIDEKLNSKYYIVPGLGDAGDLCFGPK
ncbi:MAG TPA: uracil phosphoribosyltransferase [Cyclobacteriaceae bacterium]|nr:uracil phosphoribosyltransferase [Cyclobacteriaceae bacterium]